MKWFKTNQKWSTKWAYSPDFRISCLIVPSLKVCSLLWSLDKFTHIILYWSSIVPGDMWLYRGVISMLSICQRNEESMIKQWHTLYGYAVHPEKVSWTSPCRVSSSFSSTIYSSLSTTRPRIIRQYNMSVTNLESPSYTSLNDDTYIWRGEGKETVCCRS